MATQTTIGASVGRDGVNRADDVRIVQRLLLDRGFHIGHADGICGQRTTAAIVTFQSGFMHTPDGRVDPGGKTLANLVSPVPAPNPDTGSLTRLIPKPAKSTINNGVNPVNNALMTQLLGSPRSDYSPDCQPVTEPKLRRNMLSASMGPFRVTGLAPAVQSLQLVIEDIRKLQPDIYRVLGTAGMLCCRWMRDSTTSISNHSWGTAIDLKLNGMLDKRGDNRVQYGLTLIAPIFNRYGWYWGAAFPTEDGMHFEAGRGLVEGWAGKLK